MFQSQNFHVRMLINMAPMNLLNVLIMNRKLQISRIIISFPVFVSWLFIPVVCKTTKTKNLILQMLITIYGNVSSSTNAYRMNFSILIDKSFADAHLSNALLGSDNSEAN